MGFRWLASAAMVAFVGAVTALDLIGTSRTDVRPVAGCQLTPAARNQEWWCASFSRA